MWGDQTANLKFHRWQEQSSLKSMYLFVFVSSSLSLPCQISPPYCVSICSAFSWKMEHIQCHLFTILRKCTSLGSILKRKGQALSEYCRANYSSLRFRNLKNTSLDSRYCCCYLPSLYSRMTLISLTLSCSLHSKVGYSPQGNGCVCLLPLLHDQHGLHQLYEMQTEQQCNTRRLLKHAVFRFVCLTNNLFFQC